MTTTRAPGMTRTGPHPVRPAQLALLLRRLPRLTAWQPPVLALVAASGLVTWQWQRLDGEGLRALILARLLVLIVVAGAVSTFDDPARSSTGAVPLPNRWRTGLRLAAFALFVAVAAGCVVGLVLARGGLVGVAGGGMALEVVAVAAFGAAVALLMQRHFDLDEPGSVAALTVLLLAPLLLVLTAVSGGWLHLLAGTGPDWDEAHRQWLAVGVVCVAAVGWLMRDPATPGWLSRLRSVSR